MRHRITLAILSLLLFLGSSDIAVAQSSSPNSLTPRKTKQFDRWNPRYFQPGFTGGVQAGLVPTFFKDEVHGELPPMELRLGYQFAPALSVELAAGRSITRTISLDYATHTERPCRNTFTLVSLRPTGHMRMGERMDAYGGLIIGIQHNRLEALGPLEEGGEVPKFYPRNGLMMSGFIGADYALTPRLRANLELSYGMSLLSTGVRFRLP